MTIGVSEEGSSASPENCARRLDQAPFLPALNRFKVNPDLPISDQLAQFLDQSRGEIEVGSRLYFMWRALEQCHQAVQKGNYGIGASVVHIENDKAYIFYDQNAMVSGRGVHDHAEARGLQRAAYFIRHTLGDNPLPQDERGRYFQGVEVKPDEIIDVKSSAYLQKLGDGLHVVGSDEPCIMCACLSARLGCATSTSGFIDGTPESRSGVMLSDGGGYAHDQKPSAWPDVVRWIAADKGVSFQHAYHGFQGLDISFSMFAKKLSERNITASEMEDLLNLFRRTDPSAVEVPEIYRQGNPGYYLRASLEEAYRAHLRGDDPHGAAAILVYGDWVYEFRDGDLTKTGLGFADTSISRVLDSLMTTFQDEIAQTPLDEAERVRYRPAGYVARYPKASSSYLQGLEDGPYVFCTTEPDPQGVFVCMNVGPKQVFYLRVDGRVIDPGRNILVSSRGGANCIGEKQEALPTDIRRLLSGTNFTDFPLEQGEDPIIVQLMQYFSERIFTNTREEIDKFIARKW